MFVVAQSIGTEIECADCFSKITVPPPTEKQIEVAKEQKSKILEAIELESGGKKSKDDEILDVEVDPSFGLAPVAQDLLSPVRASDGGEEDSNDFGDELTLEAPTDLLEMSTRGTEKETSQKQKANKGKSSKSKTKDAARRENRSVPVAIGSSRKTEEATSEEKNLSAVGSQDLGFPKFEFDSLFSEMVNLVSQTECCPKVRCIYGGFAVWLQVMWLVTLL